MSEFEGHRRALLIERLEKSAPVLAPVIGFSSIYFYEAGRLFFLRIPLDLIDLSVTRLIAGGAVLTLISTALFLALSQASDFLSSKAKWIRILGLTLLLGVMIFMPATVLLNRVGGSATWALCALLLPLLTAGERPRQDNHDHGSFFIARFFPFIFIVLVISINFFSAGYIVEGSQLKRNCINQPGPDLVVELQSNRLLIKEVSKKGVIVPGIEVRPADEKFRLIECVSNIPVVISVFKLAETEVNRIERARKQSSEPAK